MWGKFPEDQPGRLLRESVAPEMRASEKGHPSYKTDIWDFGFCYMELLQGRSLPDNAITPFEEELTVRPSLFSVTAAAECDRGALGLSARECVKVTASLNVAATGGAPLPLAPNSRLVIYTRMSLLVLTAPQKCLSRTPSGRPRAKDLKQYAERAHAIVTGRGHTARITSGNRLLREKVNLAAPVPPAFCGGAHLERHARTTSAAHPW